MISKEEAKSALLALGVRMEQEELDKLIQMYDLNNNGTFQYEEFLDMLGQQALPSEDGGLNIQLCQMKPKIMHSVRNKTSGVKHVMDVVSSMVDKLCFI